MRLTQKFIKQVSDSINLNGASYIPADLFKDFGGTNFESQLSKSNKDLLEIGAPVGIDKFIFLVPNHGWATAYLIK